MARGKGSLPSYPRFIFETSVVRLALNGSTQNLKFTPNELSKDFQTFREEKINNKKGIIVYFIILYRHTGCTL